MIDKIVWISNRIIVTSAIAYCWFLVIIIYYVDYFNLMTMIILLPFFFIFYAWSLFFINIQIRYKINGLLKYLFLVLPISLIVNGAIIFSQISSESDINSESYSMYASIIFVPSISFLVSDYFLFIKKSYDQ